MSRMSSTLPKALDSTGGAAAGIGGHCAKSGGRRRPGRGVGRRRGGRGRGRGGGVSASSTVARAARISACRGAVAGGRRAVAPVACEIARGGGDARARPRQPGPGARRRAARCDVAGGPATTGGRGLAGGPATTGGRGLAVATRGIVAARGVVARAPARRPERPGRGVRGAVAVAEPGTARAPAPAPGRGAVFGCGARQAAPGFGRRGGDAQEASEVIMVVCLNENDLLGRDGQTTPLGIQRGLDRRGRDAARRRSALHDRVHLLR